MLRPINVPLQLRFRKASLLLNWSIKSLLSLPGVPKDMSLQEIVAAEIAHSQREGRDFSFSSGQKAQLLAAHGLDALRDTLIQGKTDSKPNVPTGQRSVTDVGF